MTRACYRKLKRYKYQLMEPYELPIGIRGYTIDTHYLKLSEDGDLTISNGYAWDGPSGPTIDTKDFIRRSLVHDALYQMKEIKDGLRSGTGSKDSGNSVQERWFQ
jgi:methyl coenzyme M reductase gamma subunit